MVSCRLINFLLLIVVLQSPGLALSANNEHSPSGTDFWGSETNRKPQPSNGASHTSGDEIEGTDDSRGTNDQESGEISLSISNKTESTKGKKKKSPSKKKNSLSVSIGGAQIELDLPVVHGGNDSSTTLKPLNGEEVSSDGNSHLPEFVLLADDSGRKSLMELQQNTNIPKGPYQLALSSWAAKQGEPVNTSFHRYLAEQEEVGRRNREDVLRKLANLSQAARDADRRMQKIIEDPNLTKKSEEAQIQKCFNSLPKRVQKELNTLNVDGIQRSKRSP